MRTLEEIRADAQEAIAREDKVALQERIQELEHQGTKEAVALTALLRGWWFRFDGEQEQSLNILQQAHSLFQDLGDLRSQGAALLAMAMARSVLGDQQQALIEFERALEIFEAIGDRQATAWAISNIGNIHYSTGDYAQALTSYDRALRIQMEFNHLPGVASNTANKASVYLMIGDHAAALENYERAIEALQQVGNRTAEAHIRNNLVNAYIAIGDLDHAYEQSRKALSTHEQLEDRIGIGHSSASLGLVLHNMGRYPEAIERYQRTLDICVELNDRTLCDRAVLGMSTTLQAAGEPARAYEVLQGIDITKMNDLSSKAQYLGCLASLRLDQGDIQGARASLVEQLDIATTSGLRGISATCHMQLRDLSHKLGDLEGYVHHNTEYLRINEEIRGKEATEKLAVMQAEKKMEAERREREQERTLLYGALPESVATRMLRGETIEDHFENAAVLFADIVGFTTHTSSMHPSETINLLEDVYNHFDALCTERGITKVKTIGDSYLCFAHTETGDRNSESDAEERIAAVAIAMQNAEFYWPTATANSNRIEFRIGIHSGPVSAGVIGKQRLQYDVWGDTVNVASRMESTGEPGRIQVSSEFYEQLSIRAGSPISDLRSPKFTERGEVNIKGKGSMTTYWLEGA